MLTHQRLNRLSRFCQQIGHRDDIPPDTLAPRKEKNILDQPLKTPQLPACLFRESGPRLIRNAGLAKVGGIKQRRSQRRAQLMRQRGSHFPHGRQALVALQLGFHAVGGRYIVDKKNFSTGRRQ